MGKEKTVKNSTLQRRLSKPRERLFSLRKNRNRLGYVKWQLLAGIVGVALISTCMSGMRKSSEYIMPMVKGRSLAENDTVVYCNATTIVDPESKAMGEFPNDLFTNQQRNSGAIIIHFLVLTYMFSALAIVCDTFFESALERIVEEFRITDDVAGATWMAAGGSAPELATSLIGALITKSDIGFGTIVGSAVFNVLFVIGACAFVVGNGLKLTVYPLARDSTWYTCCLFAIVLAVLDQKVYPLEALGLFGMYLLYILIMKYNTRLEKWFKAKFLKYQVNPVTSDADLHKPGTEEKPAEENTDEEAEKADEDFLAFPEGTVEKIQHAILLPLKLFMANTIPNANKRPKLYLVTFTMCVVHIALYSYVMVWMSYAIGVALSIPDEVMGVTILAMGTSIPDALSSIAVAKRGHGDMAVSSSIGSNIFDITMGLPVPWLLYCFKATYFNSGSDEPYVSIQSKTIGLSVGTLLLMLVSTVAAIHWNKWQLNSKLGYMLLFLYLLFFLETLILFFIDQGKCV